MMSASRTIAAVLCLLAVAPSPARAAKPDQPRVGMVIGFVAFNSMDAAHQTNPKKELVSEFLHRASASAARNGLSIRFDLVQGNYYQVLHWLRTGAIDGAVLSPFTYDLLLGGLGPD